MIRVLLADDHRLVRAGLARLLSTAADLEVVAEASDGQQAVVQSRAVSPDVILMDLSMPVLDGVEATRQILDQQPLIRIVALTSFSESRRLPTCWLPAPEVCRWIPASPRCCYRNAR